MTFDNTFGNEQAESHAAAIIFRQLDETVENGLQLIVGDAFACVADATDDVVIDVLEAYDDRALGGGKFECVAGDLRVGTLFKRLALSGSTARIMDVIISIVPDGPYTSKGSVRPSPYRPRVRGLDRSCRVARRHSPVHAGRILAKKTPTVVGGYPATWCNRLKALELLLDEIRQQKIAAAANREVGTTGGAGRGQTSTAGRTA